MLNHLKTIQVKTNEIVFLFNQFLVKLNDEMVNLLRTPDNYKYVIQTLETESDFGKNNVTERSGHIKFDHDQPFTFGVKIKPGQNQF